MKVEYKEGAGAVILEGVGRVERGQIISVDAARGRKLLAQGWTEVKELKEKATDE